MCHGVCVGCVVSQQVHVEPVLLLVVQGDLKVIVFVDLTLTFDRIRLVAFAFWVATPLSLMLASIETERYPLAGWSNAHRVRFSGTVGRRASHH